MNGKRFDALTGFRAIAAILVFLYHNRKYWRENLHPEILRLFNEFHIGVSLFFVLSGFLIAYTYEDIPWQSKRNYIKYLLVRCARILPLYWLILTAYYIDPKYGKLNFSALTYTLTHAFSNKFNLQGISQAWSLNVEMCFYVFAPLLYFLQKKHLLYVIASIILFFGIFWSVGSIWHLYNGNTNQFFYPTKFLIEGTFAGRSIEFIVGMILAQILKSNKISEASIFKYKTLCGALGIFLSCYLIGLFQPDIYHHGNDHIIGRVMSLTLLPFFTASLIAGLITEKTSIQKFLSTKIMVLLGNASFAFYLIHISYVNLRIKQFWFGRDRNFIILWIVSIFLYLVFEKPIYNTIKSVIRKL